MFFVLTPPSLSLSGEAIKIFSDFFQKSIDKQQNISYTVVKLMIMIIVIIKQKGSVEKWQLLDFQSREMQFFKI